MLSLVIYRSVLGCGMFSGNWMPLRCSLGNTLLDGWTAYRPESSVHIRLESNDNRYVQW